MRGIRSWLAAAAIGIGLPAITGCQTWVGGMTLPSPRYLEHYPQYFSPDPPFPLPRELASMEDPTGGGVRPGPVGPVAPLPAAGQPAGLPVPAPIQQR